MRPGKNEPVVAPAARDDAPLVDDLPIKKPQRDIYVYRFTRCANLTRNEKKSPRLGERNRTARLGVMHVGGRRVLRGLFAIFAGATEGRGPDAVPRQETLLRRVQVSQVQAQVDVGQQLGQYGSGVHQMPHKRLSSQAGEFRRRAGAPASSPCSSPIAVLPLFSFRILKSDRQCCQPARDLVRAR